MWNPDQLMLDWNSVGATARFIGNGCNIQYRLWERSEGHLNLPDMTMIVETVIFDRKLGTRTNPSHAIPTSLPRRGWRSFVMFLCF